MVLSCRIPQYIELLQQLQLNTLYRCCSTQHHTSILLRRQQLIHRPPIHFTRPIKLQGRHPLPYNRTKSPPHCELALIQQCRRHHLHDQRLSITEHKRQQRGHHCALPATHQHLLHKRLSVPQIIQKLVHQLDLRIPKHQIPRVLKQQKSRVILQHQPALLLLLLSLNKVPLRAQILRKSLRLQCHLSFLELHLTRNPATCHLHLIPIFLLSGSQQLTQEIIRATNASIHLPDTRRV
mmetsp:Transcript_12479/g.14988  ORF Transcript_12479/g.14988 Transcript_12479/m.14988 type:complete len:237 (-) Transcript_12479:858-1568(-)